jgi:DNA topoisomerase I
MITVSGNYKLVICEKPAAAKRLAEILGDKSIRTISTASRIPIFDVIAENKEHYVICSALGHLYNLVPLKKNRKIYPVFDLEWRPRRIGNSRGVNRIDLVLSEIADLSKKASGYIHACDYDIEGELIGYNILQFSCNNKYEESRRAKFSTLTWPEIKNSFSNLLTPDISLAKAGRTRHRLDFVFGINLSRALSNCFLNHRDHKSYSNLTIGRVQGPTLNFVVEREKEINYHVPDPYWNVLADFIKDQEFIEASHWPKNIDTLAKAVTIVSDCKDKDGTVKEIRKEEKPILPPLAFNLGELQKEAFRVFRMSPKVTLSVAESLYLSGLISYPRTSSQKLPISIGYKDILSKLSRNYVEYREIANSLILKENLFPRQGSKEDPAHPAIYPTGEKTKKLNSLDWKIYDLAVKRFMATFGPAGAVQDSTIFFEVAGRQFIAEGKKILKEGWTRYYKPYFHISESQLPELCKGDIVHVKKIRKVDKFTRPPSRYNQASLLEAMEKSGIGTKSTRAEIINTLINRRYITQGVSGFEATEIGFAVVDSMTKFIPSVISTDLTKSFEDDLEKIEANQIEDESVFDKAVFTLKVAIEKIKVNESLIGQELSEAVERTGQDSPSLGVCPDCQKGNLVVIRSHKTRKRFIACSKYRETGCRASAPLPQAGKLLKSKETCSVCGWPVMVNILGRRKPWKFCVNLKCESRGSHGPGV